jgi:hypothetical protein
MCGDLDDDGWEKEFGFEPPPDWEDRVGNLFYVVGIGEKPDDPTSSKIPARDIIYDKIPNVNVSVDYFHPILSHLGDGDYWCGANPEENVYENPYAAQNFSWDIDFDAWNKFQSKCNKKSREECQQLIASRKRDIQKEQDDFDASYNGMKRRRDEF